jgi:glycosyltransferase involved in cell wall biosynthesis
MQHDIKYFFPTERRESHYKNIRLFPFLGESGALPYFAYETMKKSQPAVVLTIGHYSETDYIWQIKALYPHLFKWVAYLTCSTENINERYKEHLDYADVVLAPNTYVLSALQDLLTTTVMHLPFGADTTIFHDTHSKRDKDFLCVAKNSQSSNVPAFIKAVAAIPDATASIHYNIHDSGFFDMPLLLRRYGVEDRISLPDKFVSVREGLTDQSMNDLYNRHQAIVNCSMQSVTAISTLEAMSAGCLPIGMSHGATGDLMKHYMFPEAFTVNSCEFIGDLGETFNVASHEGLVQALKDVKGELRQGWWTTEARKNAREVSRIFSKDNYATEIKHIVHDTTLSQHTIIVDTLV